MTPKELQKLFNFLNVIPFRERINDDAQKKYNLAFKDLQKKVKIQNNRFLIDHNSFAEVVFEAYKKGAKYLKIHLIKESKDLNVNIGFSFSNSKIPKDLTVDHDFDFFWTLKDDKLVESLKKPFTEYKTNFKETFSELVRQSTNKKCTEFIQYDIKDVIKYMIRNFLSNTFESKKFILNFFVFKEYGDDPTLNDRIGISVHNTLTFTETETAKKKEAESIGYDFGTVYP
ncbi:hypothetical protein [Flavobacterium johnsoniae]|uniref:hypothetical protein n=1 Tax=Flavobacterium johnsoniae TaxID=986 RepID=UPI003D95637D